MVGMLAVLVVGMCSPDRVPVDFVESERVFMLMNDVVGDTVSNFARHGKSMLAGRLASVALASYFSVGFSYYNHEIAHRVVPVRYGDDGVVRVRGMRYGWPDLDWDEENQLVYYYGKVTYDDHVRKIAAGLNQNQHGALVMWRKIVGERSSLQDWMYFVFNKVATTWYALAHPVFKEAPMPWYDLSGVVQMMEYAGETGILYEDLLYYSFMLRYEGFDTDKQRIVMQAALADLLTFAVWGSLRDVCGFLSHGTDSHRASSRRVEPPIVLYYLGPEGGVYDVEALIRGRSLVAVAVQLGAGYFGSGPGSVGVRVEAWCPERRRWWWGPKVSASFDDRSVGGVIGVGARWSPNDGLAATMELTYEQDDLIRQNVFGYENGFHARFGVEMRY